MAQFFPDSYIDYTHNQTWILTLNEKFVFHIRCWDRARDDGNTHESNFVVEIETTEGEDITPPSIEATSVRNGAYVPAGVNSTLLSVYVDEPAYCKWSQADSEYSLMESYFACSGIPSSASAYFDNACTTVLNVTEATNYYYFACQDQAGNSNTENYPLHFLQLRHCLLILFLLLESCILIIPLYLYKHLLEQRVEKQFAVMMV